MALLIHVDGGARGNPGPAGAGVVIRTDGGELLYEAGFFLGRQTNNAAEYHAVIRALERAQRVAPDSIQLFSDSELLVRQLIGQYRVKSPRLADLFRQTQLLLLRAPRWSIRHVPREENRRADEMANMAMDAERDVVVFDIEQGDVPPSAAPAEPAHPEVSPGPERPPSAAPSNRPLVQVTVARAPEAGACPAGGLPLQTYAIDSSLPVGLCIHAAHAILPTLLAIVNTDAQELAAVPTLTVRCGRPGCMAVFEISPVRSDNGAPKGKRA